LTRPDGFHLRCLPTNDCSTSQTSLSGPIRSSARVLSVLVQRHSRNAIRAYQVRSTVRKQLQIEHYRPGYWGDDSLLCNKMLHRDAAHRPMYDASSPTTAGEVLLPWSLQTPGVKMRPHCAVLSDKQDPNILAHTDPRLCSG
jgi:hypothetical protein